MKRSIFLLLSALVLAGAACSPPSADDLVEDVMRTRLNYSVEPQSWIVRDGSNPPAIYIETMVINNNQDAALRTLTVLVEQLDIDDEVLSSHRVALDVVELTPGIGQSIGVTVSPAHPSVEGITLRLEPRPDREVWGEFPEFEAVRPRI